MIEILLAFTFTMVFMVAFIVGGSAIVERMVDLMKKIVLQERPYIWAKWLCIIVLPALSSLIVGLSRIWNFEAIGNNIAATITLIATFLGTILCISNYNFYKEKK